MKTEELRAIEEKELHRFRVVILSFAERIRFLAEDSLRSSNLEEALVPVRAIVKIMQQDIDRRDALLGVALSSDPI